MVHRPQVLCCCVQWSSGLEIRVWLALPWPHGDMHYYLYHQEWHNREHRAFKEMFCVMLK